MNAWLKRCVFNLDLNRESVSEPQTSRNDSLQTSLTQRHFDYYNQRKSKSFSTYILELKCYPSGCLTLRRKGSYNSCHSGGTL